MLINGGERMRAEVRESVLQELKAAASEMVRQRGYRRWLAGYADRVFVLQLAATMHEVHRVDVARKVADIAFTQHGHGAFDAEVYYSTFCRFDELLPGVAIALLESFHPTLLDTLRRHGHALLFSGILSSVAVLYGIANELPGPFFATTFGYSLLEIAFSLLTLAALSPSSLLHRVRVPGASSLALWSYAIYLVHKPLFMVIAPRTARWHADPATWPVIIAVMVSGVGAGSILYRLVETPFMRMRSRWFPTQALTGVAPSRDAKSLPDVHSAQTVP